MVRTEEVLTFPHCLFFSMVAPLHLEEFDHLAPHATTHLIKDLSGAQGMSSLPRAVSLQAIQHPRVPSSTFSAVMHGRCCELLPMMVTSQAYMPQFHISQGWGMTRCSKVPTSLSSQISSCPSLVKPLGIHGLQPQTPRVGTSCLHNSLRMTM
jgi:hypothetical protein